MIIEGIYIDDTKLKHSYWMLKCLTLHTPKRIFDILKCAPSGMTVTELFIRLRIEQAVVSQHLAMMRKYGLVLTERRGKNIIYTLNIRKIDVINRALENFFRKENSLGTWWEQTVV